MRARFGRTLAACVLSLWRLPRPAWRAPPAGTNPAAGASASAVTEAESNAPSAAATAPSANASSGDPSAPAVMMSTPPAEVSAITDQPLPPAPSAQLPPVDTLALPSGADKSGVTSKSISVPKGAGTLQGMEESFSAQLSTGIATFSVPIALPAARGGAQPSLGLSYSSSGGGGVVGMGWSIGVPFIARQTDSAARRATTIRRAGTRQDHFVFNGGQELVPIAG